MFPSKWLRKHQNYILLINLSILITVIHVEKGETEKRKNPYEQ